MRRTRPLAGLCALALTVGLATAVPAATATPGPAPAAPTAETAAKKKTGCQALKTSKQRKSCAKLRKSKKLRRGMVCSLGKAKQAEYKRAGYFCLDLSANQDGSLTYLEELGR